MRPYSQVEEKGLIMRTFSDDSYDDEFVWHRDDQDREVTVIESDGWQIQFDNSLPVVMVAGDSVFVSCDQWHRILKGKGSLRIMIRELSR